MRRFAISIFIILLVFASFLGMIVPESAGQTQDAARSITPGSGYKIRVDVNTVFLSVSARDRYNRFISHLQKEDFQVYENGVLQEVQQLVSEESPIHALLLLDNSGSTQPYLRLIKDAAIQFTRRMKPTDQIGVAEFNSLVDLLKDFTDDRQDLQRAIEKIKSIGGTALYDSLLVCINRYMKDISGRSAIVVFTDGFDNQLEGPNSEGSRTPFEVLYRRIEEIEPIIYTIFLNSGQVPRVPRETPGRSPGGIKWPWPQPSEPSSKSRTQSSLFETARQQLYMIAEQTGGRMYTLVSVEGLSPAYAEIADDLAASYYLAYNPTNTNRDGKWRKISIRVKNRPEATVRTRKGYYATEQ